MDAVVVAYENCGGTKSVDRLIDESAEDIYEAIAERYLQIGCSVMTPNKNRYELIGRLIEEYQIDGVVEMTLQACHTYNVEAKSIEKFVKRKGRSVYSCGDRLFTGGYWTAQYENDSICRNVVRGGRDTYGIYTFYMCIRNTVCWMDLVRLKSFCQEQKNLEWIASLLQIMESCMV